KGGEDNINEILVKNHTQYTKEGLVIDPSFHIVSCKWVKATRGAKGSYLDNFPNVIDSAELALKFYMLDEGQLKC
ncbi:hypothetical protein, partial [Bacteroides uniformis]|uniref:hypothetical protein n=1 Tax=Bacteroides uniformis TaxID=820 RepID=UPI001AA0CB7A